MPARSTSWTIVSLTALLSAVPLLVATAATATPPVFVQDGAGAYHIAFSSPAIYDLTVMWVKDGGDGISLSRAVLHHSSGHLIGEGRDFGGMFDVRHEITGTVKASKGVTIVKETTHSVGSIDTDDREQYKGVTKVSATIEGDGYAATYKSSTSTKYCMKTFDPISDRHEKVCVRNELSRELDYSGTGLWTIKLNPLARFKKELFGTAIIYVDDGTGGGERNAPAEVEGKIGRDGVAILKIKAYGEDPLGTVTLAVLITGGESGEAPTLVAIHWVKGKLLGQKFSEGY